MKQIRLVAFLSLVLLFNIVPISIAPLNSVAHSDEVDTSNTKFGAILPMTGNGAEQGLWIKRGLEMAKEDVRSKGMAAPDLVVEDSRGENAQAVSAYRKLLGADKVELVFTWGSGVGLSLAPLVNRDQVVQMGVATNTEKYSSANDYNFRNFPKASAEAQFLAQLIKVDLAYSNVAIVHTENDYGNSTAKMFRESFSKLGGNLATTIELQPGATDLRAQVLLIRKSKPKMIFLSAYPIEGTAFLKNLRQQGIKIPVVASAAIFSSAQTIAHIGESMEGLIQVAPIPQIDSDSSFARRYKERYREEFGAQHFYTVRAYDAYISAASALKECENEPKGSCLRDRLGKMKPYYGIGGLVKFDEFGDIQPEFSAYQIRDGHYASLSK